MIQLATLGVALCDADHKVREVGGNNKGPRIRQYLANADPSIPIAAAWCAVFVQYCSDVAARGLGVPNPLDAVRQEALVQSYYDWFAPSGAVVEPADVTPGDLVLYQFGPSGRWNHIGLVAQAPNGAGVIFAVEGNTSDESQRDGDAVALKPRLVEDQPTCFIRWGGR